MMAKTPKAKLPHGRPSKFTPAIAQEIADRLSKGEPLAQICRDEHMPSVTTISTWKANDKDFSESIARAREEGFDAIADECLKIADDSSNDYMLKKEGEDYARLNAEHVQRSKLRVETRLKLLAKWDPKRYGEKLAIGGADDLPPIKAMPDSELSAGINSLLAKLNGSAE